MRYTARDHVETLVVGSQTRRYLLHVPASYGDGAPAPLVVAFPGYDFTAEQFATYTGLNADADGSGTIVVYPQATGEHYAWNVIEGVSSADDLGFARALLDHLYASLCIDEARVYATGFSLGATMAQRLACSEDTPFAAIALVGGVVGECDPPVPVMSIHGTYDITAPYAGGTYPPQIGGDSAPSIAETVARWADVRGCDDTPETSEIDPDVVKASYMGCDNGGEVVLYTIHESGHGWPGSPDPLPEEFSGPMSDTLDASSLIMQFFADHPR
jgi:polyhydroxybutyrate depolymerase